MFNISFCKTMWKTIKAWFKKLFKGAEKEASSSFTFTEYTPPVLGWRTKMWVICENKPAILYAITGESAEIHFVNIDTGETTEIVAVPLLALRQAKYNEIPACRRGFSQESAEKLGYGS